LIYQAAAAGAASFAPVAPRRATISACVIASDEEARLPACLASVAFCDEIVVVDGGSSDATVQIAEGAGARVVHQPWLGFAAQRNVALDNASGDWVLEIDADERVSPALRREIERFLDDPRADADIGGVPIRHRYLGGVLGPAARYPDYRHRLFRRGAYRHDTGRTVHEGIWPGGPVVAFSGDLEHELAGSLGEAVRDAWSYARAEAAQLVPPSGAGPYLVGTFARPPAKLLYRLTAGGGWRDGWRGVVHVSLASLSDALVWARALTRRGGGDSPAQAGHFSEPRRAGPPHVVAVARGAERAARAARWLERAAAGGMDAALVTDAPPPASPVRARTVVRLGPFALGRAVEAEHQLRPIDAVVPAGMGERLLLWLVPRSLRGVPGFDLDSDPRIVANAVEVALRPQRGAP
jgi:hypothetical protein